MSRKKRQVDIVTPNEVLALSKDEQGEVDALKESINATLKKEFNGFTLYIDYEADYRPAVIYRVLKECRAKGWGCKVDFDDKQFTFWTDKYVRAKLEGEESGAEENSDV